MCKGILVEKHIERGQSAAETLLKNNKWNEKTLEAKAIEELHNKYLVCRSP